MIVLLLALAAAEPWCARVAEIGAREPFDHAAIVEAAALVPSQEVQSKVRALAAKDGGVALARDALATVARAGCVEAARPDAAEAARLVGELQQDPRFGGVRIGDDAIDRLLDRIWVSIGRLLESKGMQRYATGARAIYLGLLVVVIAAVLAKLVMALARARGLLGARDDEATRNARIVAQRKRSFADLRARAAEALAQGHARRAIELAMQALLVRVGERAPDAAAPSRTPREVMAALGDAAIVDVVRAPLVGFERITFAKTPDLDDARAFLSDVDGAEARLTTNGPAA